MKKWMRGYMLLLLFIVAAYLYAEYKRPPVIDWTPSLSNRDKIPYGTYVLYQSLDDILGIRPEELRKPVYDHVNNREDSGEVYVLVCGSLETNRVDEAELLRYIERGNTVLIATEAISKSLADTLNLELRPFDFGMSEDDSVRLKMVNPHFTDSSLYAMKKSTVDGHFHSVDTARAEVLGVNSRGRVNYVRYRIGLGQLLIHAAPLAFTNYFILKDGNSKYVEEAMSYLPRPAEALYWDEYYKIGRGGAATPLRVILTKPALRAAYFFALAGILLYILFQTKRRQRVIPVAVQPRNASMDFVETVSRVYYNQGNHSHLAQKKLAYFLDHIRSRYGLQTQVLDEQFEQRLAHKAGYPPDKVRVLVSVINQVRQAGEMTPGELMQFSRLIDEFHKHTDA
jgi:hypothetical protein